MPCLTQCQASDGRPVAQLHCSMYVSSSKLILENKHHMYHVFTQHSAEHMVMIAGLIIYRKGSVIGRASLEDLGDASHIDESLVSMSTLHLQPPFEQLATLLCTETCTRQSTNCICPDQVIAMFADRWTDGLTRC